MKSIYTYDQGGQAIGASMYTFMYNLCTNMGPLLTQKLSAAEVLGRAVLVGLKASKNMSARMIIPIHPCSMRL